MKYIFLLFILFSCFNSETKLNVISLFEDDVHIMNFTFNPDGYIVEKEYYVKDTISLNLNYKKNRFVNIETKEGELDLYLSKIHSNYLTALEILKEKNISFKCPVIISNNICDIAKMGSRQKVVGYPKI